MRVEKNDGNCATACTNTSQNAPPRFRFDGTHVKLMYDYVTEKSKEDINNISNQLYTQQQQKWTQKLVFDLFPDMG